MAKEEELEISRPTDQAGAAESKASSLVWSNTNRTLGVLGFSLYLVCTYLILTSSPIASPLEEFSGLPSITPVLLIVTFLIGEALISIVFVPLAPYFENRLSICTMAIAAGALLSLPSIFSLIGIGIFSETLFFFMWLFAGCGAVVLLSLWGFFLARLDHDSSPFLTALSVFIAVLLLTIIRCFLRKEVIPYTCIIAAVLSAALFLIWSHRIWSAGLFVYLDKYRPVNWRSLLHTACAMVANSFLLGFGFYFISIATLQTGEAVVLGGMLAAAVFKVIDTKWKNVYQVNYIIRAIAPVAAICFLLMPFVPLPGRCALLFLMMFIAMTDESICWTAVAEYMHRNKVSPFANMAFGRFGDIIGLLLGIVAASAIFGTSVDANITSNIFINLVVIAFVCLQVFFFRDNYTPFVTNTGDAGADAEDENDESAHAKEGAWIKACHRFAEKYELTPRQEDVLLLLAKGYPTSTIERELVVTKHTVKAHVYSIYQKAGIHSRQELLDGIRELKESH